MEQVTYESKEEKINNERAYFIRNRMVLDLSFFWSGNVLSPQKFLDLFLKSNKMISKNKTHKKSIFL